MSIDQITIQVAGTPRSPLEMVELELSDDLIHWQTQDLQLPIILRWNCSLKSRDLDPKQECSSRNHFRRGQYD